MGHKNNKSNPTPKAAIVFSLSVSTIQLTKFLLNMHKQRSHTLNDLNSNDSIGQCGSRSEGIVSAYPAYRAASDYTYLVYFRRSNSAKS